MKAFFVDYDDGGLATVETPDGSSIFLQILAKPGFIKRYVLNGDTQSLIFLWRYYEMTNDSNAKVIFDKGINYLRRTYGGTIQEAGLPTICWKIWQQQNIIRPRYHS